MVVADGRRSGQVQTMATDMGEMGFVSGRWHALVIRHKRSSALMFNKDQLEASGSVVPLEQVVYLVSYHTVLNNWYPSSSLSSTFLILYLPSIIIIGVFDLFRLRSY